MILKAITESFKRKTARAASAAFSFIWHTASQNKQMDIFDT